MNVIVKYKLGRGKCAYGQILLLGTALVWFGTGKISDVCKPVSMQEENDG